MEVLATKAKVDLEKIDRLLYEIRQRLNKEMFTSLEIMLFLSILQYETNVLGTMGTIELQKQRKAQQEKGARDYIG